MIITKEIICLKCVRTIVSENHVCVWIYKGAKDKVQLCRVGQMKFPCEATLRSMGEHFGTQRVEQKSRSQAKKLKGPMLSH